MEITRNAKNHWALSEKLANKIINGGRERKFTEAHRFSRKCNNNQTIKRNYLGTNTIGSDTNKSMSGVFRSERRS